MANTDVNILDLDEVTTPFGSGDLLLIVCDPLGDPSTNTIQIANFTAYIANTFLITQETPANSTITISQGMMLYDSNYLYIATSNNVLQRVALSSF